MILQRNRMITLIKKAKELSSLILNKKNIGFVPTMGNLHRGHLKLVERAVEENETCVISIFINPTQFGENEDFDQYPRTLECDVDLIQKHLPEAKEIIIFAPDSENEIYPQPRTLIKAPGPGHLLEGSLRPGHFDGMATVVKLLFELIKPARAYFGKKDYQQLIIVKHLIRDLNLAIELVGVDIVRDDHGLALSSRNGYLSTEQYKRALVLPKTLQEIQAAWKEKKDIKQGKEYIEEVKSKDKNFNYLALVNKKSLNEPSGDVDLILLGNYDLDGVKLIDNLELE